MKVKVRKDEAGWWIATCAEVPGMVTQARRLDQVADRAREAIGVALDMPAREVVVEIQTPHQTTAVKHYRAARARAEEAQHAAGVAARRAARELIDAGLSVRDAGAVLGVSYQRVQQLVATEAPRKSPATKKSHTVKKAPAKAAKRMSSNRRASTPLRHN
jgi:predicted RNase H-like HicB family nuclease